MCVLANALVCAIANPDKNGVAEVFDGDAEFYEVIVQVATNHDKLLPPPYQK